jgi:PKD repeat protein
MQKTANQIKSEFESLASGHYQIHSFLYAQEFEQQAYENLIYPLMLVYPLGGSLSGTTYSRNYRVIIADRVLKSEGNELEVESDTQLIALDVLAYWMKLGTNERFTITSSNTITPFWEKWGDEVTGHFVDIGIEEFYDFNSCAIPLSGSIPTAPNPCKDARISVNSVVYGNAPSDSNFNVVVKDQLGALVGSLIGTEWIVNTGGSCADSTYTITNSLGTTLYTGTIPSGGSLTQAISNSTLNVNNSASTLISSRSILAQGTDSYNVADSVAVIKNSAGTTLKSENILATASENITINDSVAVIKDSAGTTLKSENIFAEASENITINNSLVNVRKSDNVLISAVSVKAENTENYLVGDSTITNAAISPTYSQVVKATEGLILPTQTIQNNGVASGFIPSVGTINVTTNAAPTSFTITGRTIDIVVPSGSTPMDVDFSADKLTASIGENITFTDLSDQTPTHWSWRFSDGTTSIVQNPVKSYTSIGNKTITLLAGKTGAGSLIIKNNYITITGDADADAFITAAGITDPTIISAINVLVVDLKNASIWTKLKAIYPMVGGTATTHKFNLKDPRDLNAAFRLSFNGGWTHSANGALPNGSNAYADTFFANNNSFAAANSCGISAYLRTNLLNTGCDMGGGGDSTSGTNGLYIYSSFNGIYYANANATVLTPGNNNSDTRGFYITSRNNSNSQYSYHKRHSSGNIDATNVTAIGTQNGSNIIIGAGNNISNYSNRQTAFNTIHEGLTLTEINNLYTAIQSFQTTLNRQV